MNKKDEHFPEVFRSGRDTSLKVSRAVKSNIIRKIGPNLYTSNLKDEPEAIIKRNLWPIVALFVPDTVVSHRTAFENAPSPDGSVFVTGAYQRQIELPGLVIRQLKGVGQVQFDLPFMQTLYIASRPRTFLENLLPSRQRDRIASTLRKEEIEQRLVNFLRVSGESGLNDLRDKSRVIAPLLDMEGQFATLDRLIGALLRSRTTSLTAPAARAYAKGEPYDSTREPLWDAAFATLRSQALPGIPDKSVHSQEFHNAGFFDAYFSNYIEGTEFPVQQAMRIVFENEIPATRPEDAHDILGTYRLVANQQEMNRLPGSFEEFLSILKRRHAEIMGSRHSCLPGQFKTENNEAGNTLFVAPELVVGTLRQGYDRLQALDYPFARALFMMLLIAEVHPFVDGNGRMARVMMNAELIAKGQTRIFIPSVFRNEYISSLKRLTNHHKVDTLVRVMTYAQTFVSRIDFEDIAATRQTLEEHNAFNDPSDDEKLKMPDDDNLSSSGI